MKLFRIIALASAFILSMLLISCGNGASSSVSGDDSSESETTQAESEIPKPEDIIIAKRGEVCRSSLVYDHTLSDNVIDEILELKREINKYTGVDIITVDDVSSLPDIENTDAESTDTESTHTEIPDISENNIEIIVGSENRPECAEVISSLQKNEYAIKVISEDEKTKIIIAYNGDGARQCAIERFDDEYMSFRNGCAVPPDLSVKGSCTRTTNIIFGPKNFRDPFVLVDDGVYYLSMSHKNTSGSLDGEWEASNISVKAPENTSEYWAPEIHKYKGAYYIFVSYKTDSTGNRGTSVFKSDTVEGVYTEISDGPVTPHDWSCIDGTLYIDTDGQPWMIFCHGWDTMPDEVGTMCAAKLADDLTKFISEPVELFRADDAMWADSGVTDGPFLHLCDDGQLLMIWSNFTESNNTGYAVGIARSKSGNVEGPWIQDGGMLYANGSIVGHEYDGGHGMIFYTLDGQMYLSLHSPNKRYGNVYTTAMFIPITESDGKLKIIDELWRGKDLYPNE